MSPPPRLRRPELVPGRRRRRKRRERAARRRRRTLVILGICLLVVFAIIAASFGGAAAALDNCSLDSLRPVSQGENSRVYDGSGVLLGYIPTERNRQPTALQNVSSWMQRATVAIEDRRFYEHGGVDWEGILRAAIKDLEAGQAVQGASTITQQLVRNLYPISNQRTLDRKIKEACLAIKLSRKWSKSKILDEYLNAVYYGNHAYGVKAAAQTYFSEKPRALTPAQAALLAGLTQAPSDYDPFSHPDTALARRNEVLRAMLDNGDLRVRQYRDAVNTPLGLQDGRRKYDIRYVSPRDRYFFNYVYDELVAQYGASTVRTGGLKVYTTVDRRLQRAAANAIRGRLDLGTDPAAAVVSIDPQNGQIRAMTAVVPGRRENDFNLASQARRQAGSTFKAFVLTTAIKQRINPATTFYLSAPFHYQPDPLSAAWDVHTYDDSYLGSTSIENATLRSDNTVYARLTLDVGPENVAETAHDLGITTPLPPYPSMGLGSIAVSPLEMTSAYATLANGGLASRPTGIRKVVLSDGTVDRDAGWGVPDQHRAIPDWVAAEVTRILGENIESGTGVEARFGRPAAGKTGTTTDHADAWFCGYTPNLATSVWVGYPRGEIPMTNVHGIAVAGGTFPAEIWHDYMQKATTGTPARDFRPARGMPNWLPYYRGQYQWQSGSYYSSYGSSTSQATTTTTTYTR
ncbi:MAG TPA: PBP1A family penicillin-binding protein [Gaiellaceae bacterium]|nr:PBP1A family penicillin-binding protein [Gaiellaceae bacterium]